MRPQLRLGALYILASYLLISALPFFPFLQGKPIEQPLLLLATEACAWLVLWAALKRPGYFHWLILPAFFAVPTEIYLRLFYGQDISTHHLGIIAETSPMETLEFLGSKIWLLLGVSIVVLAWWWSILRLAKRSPGLSWEHRSRWGVLAACVFGLGLWSYGQQIGIASPPAKPSASASAKAPPSSATVTASHPSLASASASAEDDEDDADGADAASAAAQSSPASLTASASALYARTLKKISPYLPKLPYWAAIPYDEEVFARTWPLGLIVRIVDFCNERAYLADLADKSRKFSFHARYAGQQPEPQTIVVVIGESSRYDRWSLNGYERDTNPLLKQESNLISFSNMVTSVSATRLSVPVIVSRKPATQSLKAGFAEKSFLSAFKEAGFKTYWLSNQMSFGQFDTPISVFAKEADVVQFMNLGGFTNNSNFDQILLEPLRNAMHDPAPRKLIVLHTLGNHWNYSHRYPQTYDKWQPSLFGVDNPAYTDTKNKQRLNNSYDNSILYTDWMLEQVIANLKAADRAGAMFFVSDHGQTLYDGSCNLAFHGHNTQFEFHIPALAWYSDSYRDRHPDIVAQLQKHKKAHLSTENIFHTLLDMGDVRYPDEHLDWSFANAKFKPHTRYVDSYGWSNYDNSTFKGDCREVIDKKKPLPQEK